MNTPPRPDETTIPPQFQPAVSGPAYSRSFKLLVLLCLGSLTLWTLRLALSPEAREMNADLMVWGLAGYAVVLYMGVVLLLSTTTVGPDTLKQSWFWRKEVPLHQISHARLLRLRGLEWLVAPRLYVRAGSGPWIGYHGATPELWMAFDKIAESRPRL